MSELLDVIRERRRLSAEQAMALLDAVPSADDETKRSLLSMAGRFLADPAVIGRWVELAANEPDAGLKEAMLARIAGCDRRQIPDMAQYIRLMVDSLAESRPRHLALDSLSRLVTAYPEVVSALVQAYAGQASAQARRSILLGLCRFHTLPPSLIDFLLAEAERCDADVKSLLVDRLLRRDAVDALTVQRWLAPTEPSAIKERVLRYLLDRNMVLEEAIIGVVRTESEPAIRLLALRVLSAQPSGSAGSVQAVLDAVRDDPDAHVRAEAALAFQQAVQPTPEILSALLQALRSEKSRSVAQLILAGLIPHASSSPAVRSGLLALAGENLHVDLAAAVHEALGRMLLWDEGLLPHFLAAYERAQSDRARSILLEALSKWPDPDERLIRLYRDALEAPDAGIRQWGVQGLLRIPMTEEQVQAVAAGAGSMLDVSIDRYLRRDLARKVACIPDPSPELRAVLVETAAHADDKEIRDTCRRALARHAGGSASPAEELERWYRQMAVDHEVQGVFPAIYGLYDRFPEECARILKLAVLDPACRDKLYYNDFPVSAAGIMQFLLSRDALDDDLCRYCVEQALTAPGQGYYVGMLRSRPSFPELRTTVWRILESIGSSGQAGRALLLELIILVYGGEVAAEEALRERLLRLSHPAAAMPYLRFLDDNRYWGPVKPMLAELLAGRVLLDADNLKLLRDCIRELFPGMDPEAVEPGLADD